MNYEYTFFQVNKKYKYLHLSDLQYFIVYIFNIRMEHGYSWTTYYHSSLYFYKLK